MLYPESRSRGDFFYVMMQRSAHTTLPYLRTHRRMHTSYSQKEVGLLLGYQTGARVAKWERGTDWPSLANGLLLGYLYRTPAEELFGDLLAPLKEEVARRAVELRDLKPQRSGRPGSLVRSLP